MTDSGAFYTGRSWIDRGNVIKHSVFSHIVTTEKVYLGSPSVQAIYLDDQVYTACHVTDEYVQKVVISKLCIIHACTYSATTFPIISAVHIMLNSCCCTVLAHYRLIIIHWGMQCIHLLLLHYPWDNNITDTNIP